MNNQNDKTKNLSVLFCKKELTNDTLLVYKAENISLPDENRYAYRFILERLQNGDIDRTELCDVTSDPAEATDIFNLITSNDVFPCHLTDVIEDYLSA